MTSDPNALPWGDLEDPHAPNGTWRRIHPHSSQDLRLEIGADRRRRLTVGLTAGWDGIAPTATTGGVAVSIETLGARTQAVVELRDPRLAPVFDALVADIARHVAQEDGLDAAVLALTVRFGSWVNLLRQLAGGGLGDQERRGLFGELTVLADLTVLAGQLAAVQAWTGPSRAHQDFQLADVAIEVKTTATKNPQTILVASERELDEAGTGTLLLVRLSVDERRGGEGASLRHLVQSVRSLLSDPMVAADFDARLAATGYEDGDHYDEPRYTIRRRDEWRVHADFPRIVEGDLRDGVGRVTYGIVTSGLDEYGTSLIAHFSPRPED